MTQQNNKTNFKIIIEYDGKNFSGWQIQKDRITIQAELEKNLSKILNQPIKVTGSGRTDAGVHAYGQVANFLANTNLPCHKIKHGINSIINKSIVIKTCSIVNQNFHARYDALSKEYHYYILNRSTPCAIQKNYVWHIKKNLNLDKMIQCCSIIKGRHDFKSFEGAGSPKKNSIREIFSAGIVNDTNNINKNTIIFKISANGFLRYMVRNIIGTIVLAGLSKISTKEFENILTAKNRDLAGATAPAQGLFLMNVEY